eukprot:TRINITY_DN9152_c0_g1_i1.p1 TRINITY_DN9152_c0_g1~~TRINITY_DN9152_c0_g1_i1.p1  ORF type:complete len:469 (+),score=111.86 TRINITY_DN9152_c0_g1_i1:81-1487(+)
MAHYVDCCNACATIYSSTPTRPQLAVRQLRHGGDICIGFHVQRFIYYCGFPGYSLAEMSALLQGFEQAQAALRCTLTRAVMCRSILKSMPDHIATKVRRYLPKALAHIATQPREYVQGPLKKLLDQAETLVATIPGVSFVAPKGRNTVQLCDDMLCMVWTATFRTYARRVNSWDLAASNIDEVFAVPNAWAKTNRFLLCVGLRAPLERHGLSYQCVVVEASDTQWDLPLRATDKQKERQEGKPRRDKFIGPLYQVMLRAIKRLYGCPIHLPSKTFKQQKPEGSRAFRCCNVLGARGSLCPFEGHFVFAAHNPAMVQHENVSSLVWSDINKDGQKYELVIATPMRNFTFRGIAAKQARRLVSWIKGKRIPGGTLVHAHMAGHEGTQLDNPLTPDEERDESEESNEEEAKIEVSDDDEDGDEEGSPRRDEDGDDTDLEEEDDGEERLGRKRKQKSGRGSKAKKARSGKKE